MLKAKLKPAERRKNICRVELSYSYIEYGFGYPGDRIYFIQLATDRWVQVSAGRESSRLDKSWPDFVRFSLATRQIMARLRKV